MTPAQSLMPENLAEAATFDRDALDLTQIGNQPIQRPGTEGQIQFIWRRQRGLNHYADIFGCIDRWPTITWTFLQSRHPKAVEAANPAAGCALVDAELLGDLLYSIALIREENELRAFDTACGQLA
jgi:hypothetical protein